MVSVSSLICLMQYLTQPNIRRTVDGNLEPFWVARKTTAVGAQVQQSTLQAHCINDAYRQLCYDRDEVIVWCHNDLIWCGNIIRRLVSLFASVSFRSSWDLMYSWWKCRISYLLHWWEWNSQTTQLYLCFIDHRHFCHSKRQLSILISIFTFSYVRQWCQLHKVY